MGTINSVRLININYNNNAIRINDETLHFNGESTLVSLMNGGGKSVMIQMLTAPFVHAKYRNVKDRPFDSYFTVSRPSFILIEWLLDGDAGKLMNGFMIRRNQEDNEENPNLLDIMGVISEYDRPCLHDINNLPVLEKTKKEITLKTYLECRNLFESLKKDRDKRFYCYDMNQYAHSRQYFDKLREYKIDFREWEEIIKKVNENESGLSYLFADCKDEKGLIEKWLLKSVEKKLDPEGIKIRNFRDITGKYIRQYRDNESKIKQRDNIELFKDNVVNDGERISAKTLAADYTEKIAAREESAERIADFRDHIESFSAETSRHIAELDADIKTAEDDIKHIDYERYSYEIYEVDEERRIKTDESNLTRIELDQAESRLKDVLKKLHILECAKRREECDEVISQYNDKKSRHALCMKENEDLTPRLEALGRALYTYYDEARRKLTDREKSILADKEEKSGDRAAKQALLVETGETLDKKIEEIGRLSGAINSFSKREDEFNDFYHTGLTRNVIGRYEDGRLDVMLSEVKRDIHTAEEERRQIAADKDLAERQRNKLLSDRENAIVTQTRLEGELRDAERELMSLEDEKGVREDILRFLQLDKAKLFDKSAVISALDGRLGQIDAAINEENERLNLVLKELKALTEGEIMELPKALQDDLEKLGLDMTSGMKWLKNNGYSKKKNTSLVRKNPFLPYALILTDNEFSRLKEQDEIYTSLPVPIISRDRLEDGIVSGNGKVVELEGISFYLNFNEAFLDEELLARMIENKKRESERARGVIENRKNERKEYNDKRGIINNQKLTYEKYEGAASKKKSLADEAEEAAGNIKSLTEMSEENERQIASYADKIKEYDKVIGMLKSKEEGLVRFSKHYSDYLEALERKNRASEEAEELRSRKRLTEEVIDRLMRKITELDRVLLDVKREIKDNEKRISAYAPYKEKEIDKALYSADIGEIESEFKTIKEKYTGELSELEKDMQRLDEMIKSGSKELGRLKKKYGLTNDDIKDVKYDEVQDDDLSIKEKEQAEIRRNKAEELHIIEKAMAKLEQRRADLMENMRKDTGYDEALPIENIADSDFGARKNRLLDHKKGLIAERDGLNERNGRYRSMLDSLGEYEEMKVTKPVQWECDLHELSAERLKSMLGDLKRDYNRAGADIQRCRNALSDRLNEILNIPGLSDAYYRKPVEAMIRLLDSPKEVLEQIEITVQSYDTLMEKIAVDISMIERERDEIISELLEYTENVNAGLGKIDSNSAISVRDQRVKMLQITVPDWQENKETYSLKLKDHIEALTKAVIEILNKNENPEEYIGLKVNVRTLYDVVVGIGSVGIQIYKVEKQRAYQITWSDAARNSGGEGFLSAFIILSSLLYYIRKDENDVFAQRNEGKVLLMDNPFAQTNAEHLLKPLMDMAKKNNTQLICLTGLGGESIYGRFDNIYVLNLVSAKLNGGMQYLRTEHTKGAEPENMEVSQVEVYDQITLF